MNTHRWTVMLVLAAGTWHAAGQTAVDLSRQGKLGTGTTLPVRCTAGQIFFKTDAAAGANLYACTTPNTWSVMGLPLLSGDASGTQQSLTVKGMQGHGVSAAAPADQNVLRWNAATGQWEPGMVPATGTAAPPSTCAPGSLYLLSDTNNNIQQLYVCSKTNQWSMTSTGSGPASNRPVNCLAGQTWMSTDTGAMTYCSVTGNPGTWSATLTGPPGPAGANGNTILSGAGAPSAPTGANGDFYLNTVESCLYGPKASGAWPGSCTYLTGGSPNFSATAGTSTLKSLYSANGLVQTAVDPGCNLPSDRSQLGAICWDNYLSGLDARSGFNWRNNSGFHSRMTDFNGTNDLGGATKTSFYGLWDENIHRASGQRFGLQNLSYCHGTGDCFGVKHDIYYGSFGRETGGEGIADIAGGMQQEGLTHTPAGTVSISSCQITSLAQPVTKSESGPQAVSVNGPTTNCHVGEWLTVDSRAYRSYDNNGRYNIETVQLTAVAPGTITALFHMNHLCIATGQSGTTCAPVRPSYLVSVPANLAWGQGRIVTDIDAGATTYSTGTAQTSQIDNHVTGSGGANWSGLATAPDGSLMWCIEFGNDVVTYGPFSHTISVSAISKSNPAVVTSAGHGLQVGAKLWVPIAGATGTGWTAVNGKWLATILDANTFSIPIDSTGFGTLGGAVVAYDQPLVSPYPIQSITDGTHLLMAMGLPGGTSSWGSPGAYILRPCYVLGAFDLSYNPTDITINGIVLESGSQALSTGHIIAQDPSPYSDFEGSLLQWTHYGPLGNPPNMMAVANLGYASANYGFAVWRSDMIDDATHSSYTAAFHNRANTRLYDIDLEGQNMSGVALNMITSTAGAGDPKQIKWGGATYGNGWIQPDLTGAKGMIIDSQNQQKVTFDSAGWGTSVSFLYGNLTGHRDLTIPDSSGTILTTSDLGPGVMARTIPAAGGSGLNEVDIGSFDATSGGNIYGSATFEVYVSAGNADENVTKTYSFGVACCSISGWRTVVPHTDSGASNADGHGTNFALDVQTNGTISLRLRRTGGDGSAIATRIALFKYNGTNSFVPSTNTAAVSDPGAFLPTTTISQVAGSNVIPQLAGGGKLPLCVDNNGKIYAGQNSGVGAPCP